MLHVVTTRNSSGAQYVDGVDEKDCLRILTKIGFDVSNATVEPHVYEAGLPLDLKVWVEDTNDNEAEDATELGEIPLLGGQYILKLRDANGWTPVASVRMGTFWTDVYNLAIENYGADNVSYDFVLDKAAK